MRKKRLMSSAAAALATANAAQGVLAISQRQLTSLQTMGYDLPTKGDRDFRMTPNYPAMPWPHYTGTGLLQTYDPNNMQTGRASVNASAFAAPWQATDATTARNPSQSTLGTVGVDMAPTGDLDQIYHASFGGPPVQQSKDASYPSNSLFENKNTEEYQKTLNSMVQNIRSASSRDDVVNPLPNAPKSFAAAQRDDTALRGNEIEPMRLDMPKAKAVYGDSSPLQAYEKARGHYHSAMGRRDAPLTPKSGVPQPPVPASHFPERLRLCLSGVLYDMMHYDEISWEDLEREGCGQKLTYVLRRDGRLPYLSLSVVSVALVAVLLYIMLRRRRPVGAYYCY
jgi:hypothetical protein